jgi:dipeptidyl aminopeptidase/acylaminoacyl peptidase
MTEVSMGAWKRVTIRGIGGLTEVGFSPDERFVLIVSWQGRGLLDTQTGEIVARDSEAPQADSRWLREEDGMVLGIGPLAEIPIRCVGLWGGELPTRSGDAVVEVSSTGDEVRLRDERSGVNRLLQRPVTEVRAAGFSPSGEVLVVATSGDIEILRRAG